jgi:hypothetical protein
VTFSRIPLLKEIVDEVSAKHVASCKARSVVGIRT